MLPIIAGLLANGLNILGSAVLTKGKAVIEQKLGIDLERELQTDEGKFKLKQLELTHEEFLLGQALESRKMDLGFLVEENKNVADARAMNSNVQTDESSTWLAKTLPYILDSFILLSTVGLAYLLFFRAVPPANENILNIAFGSFLGLCGTVVNFHRGTSRTSQAKDVTIANLSIKEPT